MTSINKYANCTQSKQLVNGCIEKRGYETEDEAAQKGMKVYRCLYCSKYHRTTIRKPVPRTPKPREIPKPCPGCAALKAQLEKRGKKMQKMQEALNRYRGENYELRLKLDATLEGRIRKVIGRLRYRVSSYRSEYGGLEPRKPPKRPKTRQTL